MNELAGFTPEQGRLLWQWYLSSRQQNPHIQQNYPQRRPIDEVSPHRVFVLNTESEVIPPYACMRVTGVDIVGGQTVVKVEKPTELTGEFLFNCQFEIPVAGGSSAGVGWAYRYGVVIMQGNGTPPTAANVEYSPIVGSWEIAEGAGPFIVFGEHNVGTDTLIGRFSGSGAGTHEVWATIESVECDEYTQQIEYVLATPIRYTGGRSTTSIPEIDSYGMIRVESVCSDIFTAHYTSDDLPGKTLRATYMWDLEAEEPVQKWYVDGVCGGPECA